MAGRGSGAGPLPSDHPIRGCVQPRERRQRSKKCVQQKMTTLKYCARPTIIDRGVQMPVGGRTPPSVPRAAGHPLFGYRKIATIFGYWRSTGPQLTFCIKLCKTRPQSATIYRKMEILLFCPFWTFFFASFLPLFSPFFALIRVTLGFFVVFPNKSHTLIRVTLGFEFFGLNKSHTLIRVTFGVK